jgi:hypothetical protein
MKYAISMDNGAVEIMDLYSGTPEEAVAKWHESKRKRVLTITPVNDADIPADRTFRDAWTLNGSAIGHDMTKAAALQLARIKRVAGAEVAKAYEPQVAAAKTTTELKAIGPATR